MRLAGRVAIVTGGARHIGAVYARKLAEEGAAVVIGDILDGDPVADEIRARAVTRWRSRWMSPMKKTPSVWRQIR